MATVPREAGVSTRSDGESTALCFSAQRAARPSTPERLVKFRKSSVAAPGQRVLHPGLYDDFKDKDPMKLFGNAINKSDHVEDAWNALGVGSEFAEAKYAQKESIYKSSKREPLGKSSSRDVKLPERVLNPGYRFGVPSDTSASGKNLLYPAVDGDSNEFHDQYIRSHGSFAPGEQRRRNYNWDLDLKSHSFGVGMGSHSALNGNSSEVASSLRVAENKRISTKQTEDLKELQDQLGRVRNLGHGNSSRPAVYGKPSNLGSNASNSDARACIEGSYAEHDQLPDIDLGKSVTPGFRNFTLGDRAFGVPTVRADIQRPAVKSIADSQNYGDDVSAQFLLYPQAFSSMGVSDEEFLVSRPKAEVFDLVASSIGISEEQFSRVWASLEAQHEASLEATSLFEFQRASLGFRSK